MNNEENRLIYTIIDRYQWIKLQIKIYRDVNHDLYLQSELLLSMEHHPNDFLRAHLRKKDQICLYLLINERLTE